MCALVSFALLNPKKHKITEPVIRLCFSHNYKRGYINTNIRINSKYWINSKKTYVSSKHPLSGNINNRLREIIADANQKIQQMHLLDMPINFKNFKGMIQKNNTNFYDYSISVLRDHYKDGIISKSSHDHYVLVFKSFKKYFGDVSIHQISASMLREYRSYQTRISSKNTASHYLICLSRTFTQGMKDEIIKANPVSIVDKKISYEKLPKALTYEQHAALENLYFNYNGEFDKLLNGNNIIESLKRFLFRCMTSIRFSESRLLKYNQIHRSLEGWNLHIQRGKNKDEIIIPLSERALQFINLNKVGTDEPIFAYAILRTENDHLIKISDQVFGVRNLHITTHTARHTFGTLALNNGMNLDMVQNILGHTSRNMTLRYAKFATTTKSIAINNAFPVKNKNTMNKTQVYSTKVEKEYISKLKSIGQQLSKSGMTDKEAAKKIGVSKAQFSKMKSGNSVISYKMLLKMKNELNISL